MEELPAFSQIVVVGSSAGGVDALSRLVATLPADLSAPIVVAQHLDPSRSSHLEAILSKTSMLPVRTVSDHLDLEPGVIYIIPPGSCAEISDHDLRVQHDNQRGPLPSIDLLFTTAAAVFGENTIAVVLSGTGTDGAAGARDVKASGGTVIIQNPDTASFPGMPLALAPNIVDVVANLESIGPLLGDLLSRDYPLRPPEQDTQLSALLDRLRERSSIDFSTYKTPTIMRRLRRRMAATGENVLSDYILYLQRNPDEYQRLIASFLIKVTEFFRDPEMFNYLRDHILMTIMERVKERGELRIWSAGCATGEEAYSLAILVAEVFGEDLAALDVRIFATDLDDDAVSVARRGLYPASSLSTMPQELIDRYFTLTDDVYEVRKPIRSMVVFGQHDLGQRAPFPRIDIVLCRNVLIYFASDLQKRALQLFAFSLRDGGYLVLGKAETVSQLPEHFALEQPRLKIYRRVGERILIPPTRIRGATSNTPQWTMPPRSPRLDLATRHTQRRPPEHPRTSARAESSLLRLPVGIVFVDASYDIQMINSAARRLLGIHGVAIGEDLIHRVRTVPPRELRSGIDAAFAGVSTTITVEVDSRETTTGQPLDLELRCHSAGGGPGGASEGITIVITDISESMRGRRERERLIMQLEQTVEGSAEQISRLTEMTQMLVAANEELSTMNAEMRDTNEELLLANEEVQSATEEVETLNEELQATNEEMETLNEELQATVEELNATNEDLQIRSLELQDSAISLEEQRRESDAQRDRIQAILNNLGDAVLVVGSDGKPVLSNHTFQKMFGESGEWFHPEDASGTPLDGPAYLQQRVARGEPFTTEFTIVTHDGVRHWFEAIGKPIDAVDEAYRDVLVIRDISDRGLRRQQEEFLALASHELRSPLTSLIGSLQLLQRVTSDGENERIRRYADIAHSQAQQLSVLVGDLVDIVRLQTRRFNLQIEPVDLTALIRDTATAAESQTHGQSIRIDTPDEEVMAQVDHTRIGQVVMNILANAIKYADGTEYIDVRLRRDDGAAVIEIQDYGPGIPASDRELIFSRFFQVDQVATSRVSTGLGLGLYISREIVKSHGGRLEVSSEVGQGTTFTTVLPL